MNISIFDTTCRNTSDCITEWCFGCLLLELERTRAALAATEGEAKP
jgi:hypothetical protein